MPSSPTPLARSSTLLLQLFLSSQVLKPWRLICGICLCLRCLVSPPSPILHLSRCLRLLFSLCSLCPQRASLPTGIALLARRLSPPSAVPSNKVSFAASPTLLTTLSPNIPLSLYPLRSGTWVCSARTYPRPDRRSLPLALAPLHLSLQPVALAPVLPPSTTPFLPAIP